MAIAEWAIAFTLPELHLHSRCHLHRANTLEKSLKELKKTVLEEFCDTMACEKATIMFLDAANNELCECDLAYQMH